MAKKKASPLRTRPTRRNGGGVAPLSSIHEDKPVVSVTHATTHIAPRIPHKEDLRHVQFPGAPSWLGDVSYSTPVFPIVHQTQHYNPVDLMSMAHGMNEKHFRDYLPVDPFFHNGTGKHRGGSLWNSIASTAETAFEGVGSAVAAGGAAIAPIAPEFGLPIAAAGGVTAAVGAGFGALKDLGGSLARGDLMTIRGGGLAGDIGSGMKDVGSFIAGSGYDIAKGMGTAAGFVGLKPVADAFNSVGKVPFQVSGNLLSAAGQGLSALDKLF